MMSEPFTHLFPEWQLSLSLAQACGNSPLFWENRVIYSVQKPKMLQAFSDIYAITEPLRFSPEFGFPPNGAEVYGISDKDHYKKTFWSLRPDFLIESENHSLLILLEAKSGQKVPKPGTRPKEALYYEFLGVSRVPKYKGFYYIIPKIQGSDYMNFVSEHFCSLPGIDVGLIYWEDLLPVIARNLLEVALDEILKIGNGLQQLRLWQRIPKNL